MNFRGPAKARLLVLSPVNSGMFPLLQNLTENAPSAPCSESRNARSIPESLQGAEKVKLQPQHSLFQWLPLGTFSELSVKAVSSAWLTTAHNRQNGSSLWLSHSRAHSTLPQRWWRGAVCGFCHLSILQRPPREGAGQAGVSPSTQKSSFQQPTPLHGQPEPFSVSQGEGL